MHTYEFIRKRNKDLFRCLGKESKVNSKFYTSFQSIFARYCIKRENKLKEESKKHPEVLEIGNRIALVENKKDQIRSECALSVAPMKEQIRVLNENIKKCYNVRDDQLKQAEVEIKENYAEMDKILARLKADASVELEESGYWLLCLLMVKENHPCKSLMGEADLERFSKIREVVDDITDHIDELRESEE